MVLPTGPMDAQMLTVVDKDADGATRTRKLMPVRFTMLETVR
jgi:protein-L-isoaspartate(D-aspartate) O-methyltransferase